MRAERPDVRQQGGAQRYEGVWGGSQVCQGFVAASISLLVSPIFAVYLYGLHATRTVHLKSTIIRGTALNGQARTELDDAGLSPERVALMLELYERARQEEGGAQQGGQEEQAAPLAEPDQGAAAAASEVRPGVGDKLHAFHLPPQAKDSVCAQDMSWQGEEV